MLLLVVFYILFTLLHDCFEKIVTILQNISSAIRNYLDCASVNMCSKSILYFCQPTSLFYVVVHHTKIRFHITICHDKIACAPLQITICGICVFADPWFLSERLNQTHHYSNRKISLYWPSKYSRQTSCCNWNLRCTKWIEQTNTDSLSMLCAAIQDRNVFILRSKQLGFISFSRKGLQQNFM